MDTYLSPAQVMEIIPGITRAGLAQLRYEGKGPAYLKPTAKLVVYKRSVVLEWLEASARTGTAAA
ncbi:hypothetical protein D6T64_05680 [Cryobacterium melibiosiphilum]|uniref:DNA-binding protein n=1 Tax=Cryobacterium melibiosiphilum TaxID=995039 RepID=A0A3A5MPU6_9MICO|nr:hypothetical protein D6T64_05680 [Cryobacterium melibiosiphilum]